jgi:FkbM family methyltransferase
VNGLARFERLEHLGGFLRRLGLGRMVDRVRPLAMRRLGRLRVHVDGVALTGTVASHTSYVRELQAGREGFMARLFVDAISEGAHVLDAGAHLGYFTIRAAHRVGPAGRVIALEPNRETFAMLDENVRTNGVADRVDLRSEGLADHVGESAFYATPLGETSSRYALAGGAPTTIRVVRGDDRFADLDPFDVVKLDIEGGEVEALRGMRATLARGTGSLDLFVECNPEALARAGTNADELLALVKEFGFTATAIDEETQSLVAVSEVASLLPYVNLLCTRRPR